MSYLADWELRAMADELGVSKDHIQPASVDLRLGGHIRIKRQGYIPQDALSAFSEKYADDPVGRRNNFYKLWRGVEPEQVEVTRNVGDKFLFIPGEMYICHSVEYLNIPNGLASALFMRSSYGRAGATHKMAGWIDPGFHGHLDFEFDFDFPLEVTIGTNVAQIVLLKGELSEKPYQGRYQGQRGAVDAIRLGEAA